MKITSYKCDLCGFTYDMLALVGFEYADDNTLVVKDQNRVERHWCRRCAKAVLQMSQCMAFSDFVNLKKD